MVNCERPVNITEIVYVYAGLTKMMSTERS